MTNEYRNDPMDRENIGVYFPEIFNVFSHTVDGKYVYLMNIKTNYLYWCDEAVEYFNLPSNRIYDGISVWGNLIESRDKKFFFENIDDLLSGKIDEHELTYRVRNRYGEYVTCSCKGRIVYNREGEMQYFAGTVVNHQKSAKVDTVTGLSNRESLFTYLNELHRIKKKYYILVSGIRQFFKVNSSFGYDYGNKVLGELAETWRRVVRSKLIYRTEGTKIVVIFDAEKYQKEEITRKFDIIFRKFKSGVCIDDTRAFIEIYGSLMLVDDHDIDINVVYNNAMYSVDKAKKEESTSLFVVNDELFLGNVRYLKKLNHIRNCIPNGCKGFYLVYQPIVSSLNDKLVGVEVLLRWQDEVYGNVPPIEFIDWLEGDTLFYELGNWILRTAFVETREIVEEYPDIVVNINLAYAQLQNINFRNDLCDIMTEEGFDPKNLKLELTERCKLVDMENLRNDLAFFKSMNIQTALDDFGTGYSALDLMVELPIDQIKIDKTFINDVEVDLSRQSILKAITSCANELGKSICVEGIETKEKQDYISNNYGVTRFQGYYYSKPLDIESFKEWLKDNG